MAIWQVPIFLVYPHRQPVLVDETLTSSIQELQTVFPEEKSWCSSIRQFGHIDSTCIELDITPDGTCNEIAVRLDVRSITPIQLQAIAHFSNDNGLFVQYGTQLLAPRIDTLVTIIKASDASRFLTDPAKFLENLKERQM